MSIHQYQPNNTCSYLLQQGQQIDSAVPGGIITLFRDKNRKYSAVMQNDGNFVIYVNDSNGSPTSNSIWASNTHSPYNSRYTLSFDEDGNLNIQNTVKNISIWSSTAKTFKTGGPFFAEMKSNGQLVIYNNQRHVTWFSKSINRTGDIKPVTELPFNRNSVLSFVLLQNQYLQSNVNDGYMFDKNKNLMLRVQPDGTVGLYTRGNDGKYQNVIWSTGTNGGEAGGPYKLIMQDDGNLVEYNNQNQVIWSSGTNGLGVKGEYYAEVTTTGQLFICDKYKDILWFSK
ncbi:hypothetical protein ACTFIZ_008109 [Dictyostelium cf. discoideum]